MTRRAPWVAVLLAVAAAALLARACGDAESIGEDGAGATQGDVSAPDETLPLGAKPRLRAGHATTAAAPAEIAPGVPDPTISAADLQTARSTDFTAIVLRGENNAPIAGATVLVADRLGHRDFATDARGRAAFRVAPGNVNFGVVAPGRAREQGSLGAGADPIERTFVLLAGAQATGRITDARTGAPIEGAEVMVRIGGFDGLSTYFWAGDWEVGHATTGPDGRFLIEGMLPKNTFTLHASAAGHADGERGVTPHVPGRCAADLALEPGRTVRGVVLEPDGSPAPGVEVRCRPAWARPVQHGPFGDGSRTGRSDAKGRFEFAGLDADGVYLVRARSDEYGLRVAEAEAPPGADDVTLRFEPLATLRVRAVGPDGAAAAGGTAYIFRRAAIDDDSDLPEIAADGSQAVSLSPGRYRVEFRDDASNPRPGADALLAAGQETTCEIPLGTASFEGRVVDLREAPVDGARVTLRETAPDGRESETTTDEAGKFRIEGLAAGRHRLQIGRGGSARREEDVEVPSPARDWLLAAAGTARIELPGAAEGHAVRVEVDVPATGDASGPDGWAIRTTAEETSQYSPADPLRVTVEAAGTVRFRIYVEGFLPARVTTVASTGVEFPVAVEELLPGERLRGQVLDPQGRPIPSAQVSLVDPEDSRQVEFTDSEGRFTTSAVATGRVLLYARPPGEFLSRTVAVVVAEGGTEPVTIRLSAGGEVDATLVDARGLPVPNRDLRVTDELGRDSTWGVRTDHRGRARFRVNPGTHRVEGDGVEPASVTVAEGAERSLRLVAK